MRIMEKGPVEMCHNHWLPPSPQEVSPFSGLGHFPAWLPAIMFGRENGPSYAIARTINFEHHLASTQGQASNLIGATGMAHKAHM